MQIHKLTISNFRAIDNLELNLSNTTVLIGENNSGKSTIVSAIALFFDTAPKVTEADFHNGRTGQDIEIYIEFGNFTEIEHEQFQSSTLNGRLCITRSFNLADKSSGRFYVSSLSFDGFKEIRDSKSAKERRELYKALRETVDLPSISSAEEIEQHLCRWEETNKERLSIQKLTGFRGFQEVALAQLKTRTEFILIPAVKSASEEVSHDKSSPIKQLVNAIARQTITNKSEYATFVAEANAKVRELTSPEAVEKITEISKETTKILSEFYKDSALDFSWKPVEQLNIPYPAAEVRVRDGNFETNVDRVGHGLQRAIILTIVQYLAKLKVSEGLTQDKNFEIPQSDVLLAIEEPEIYQHPSKQRVFSQVLSRVSEDFSRTTGIRIQVVLVTHSPLFVNVPDLNNIRIVRKDLYGDQPRVTVSKTTLSECSAKMAQHKGAKIPFSDNVFAAKLHVFNPEVCEGFFAKKIVLVEGSGDKAVLNSYFRSSGIDLAHQGIVVINVLGKTNLPLASLIFSQMKIPTFVIFDSDKEEKKNITNNSEINLLIQKICGSAPENAVEWPEGVNENWAVLGSDLEHYVRSVVGSVQFEKVVLEISKHFGVEPRYCFKSSASASGAMLRFISAGFRFSSLEAISAKLL